LAQKLGSYTLALSYLSLCTLFIALFEIPTGILSDKIGRKKTLILASLLECGESVIYIIAHNNDNQYYFYVISSIFIGLSCSLCSGTETAMLYETTKELKKKNKFHHLQGRFDSITMFSFAGATLIGGLISEFSFLLIFYLNLFTRICAVIISLFFIEPKNVERTKDHPLLHFKKSLKNLFKNKKLKNLSIGKIIEYGFSGVTLQFSQIFLKTIIPNWLIGLTLGLKNLAGGIGFWIAGKTIDKLGYFKTIIGSTILTKIINIFAAVIANIFTPFIFVIDFFIRAPCHTALEKLFQQEFTNKQRATMSSINSFFENILFAIISLGAGILSDITNPQITIITLLVCSSIGGIFYYKALKMD